MKNICFFIGSIGNSGGTERVTSIIANQLLNIPNYSVCILSLNNGFKPFFELDEKIKIDELFSGKVSMKKNFLSCIIKLRQYVKKNKINTFIVVDSISCVFSVPALWALNINHICWEHFNFKVDLGVSMRNLGRKWAAKYCDSIVTLTQRDKELWEKGLRKINAKIIPIPNPTPFEGVGHIPSLDYKIVLAVGRLNYEKGFDLLIAAWSNVCQENNDWLLRIVGGGEDEEKLKKQAKDLGINNRIDFVAATKNIDLYYRTASFYCMSSRFEGLPMVLLEAQAYGLPIVSFDCDTGPSEIVRDGYNGLLIPNQNEIRLGEGILKMINLNTIKYDLQINFSLENIKKFDVKVIIKKWIVII